MNEFCDNIGDISIYVW